MSQHVENAVLEQMDSNCKPMKCQQLLSCLHVLTVHCEVLKEERKYGYLRAIAAPLQVLNVRRAVLPRPERLDLVSRVAAVSASLHCRTAPTSVISATLALKLSGWKGLKLLFLMWVSLLWSVLVNLLKLTMKWSDMPWSS